MRDFVIAVSVAVSIVSGAGSNATAKTDFIVSGEEQIRQKVYEQLKYTPTKDGILKALSHFYLKTETDGVEGISEQDYELNIGLDAMEQRRRFLEHYWLPYDLNLDLVVTRAEIEKVARARAYKSFASRGARVTPTEAQLLAAMREIIDRVLSNYNPGAERITMADANAAAVSATDENWQRARRRGLLPLDLDRNADQIVSREEFDSTVMRAFARYDRNGDGNVDKDELVLAKKDHEQKAAQQKKEKIFLAKLKKCNLVQVPAAGTFVMLNSHSRPGGALTNVTLGDTENVVHIEQIEIEPGTGTLVFAIVSRHSTIWQFSGAVERVSRVLIGTEESGVTGLAADKVTFTTGSDCLPYAASQNDRIRKQVDRKVKSLLGRAPDRFLMADRLGRVSVPSMTVENEAAYANLLPLPDHGPGASLRQRFARLYPAGVVDLDPDHVVANAKAERRQVLPGYAGLAQLLDQGALEATDYALTYPVGPHFNTILEDGEHILPSNISEKDVFRFPVGFTIRKKIRIPAGHCGGVFPKLTLAPGVPLPELGSCHPKIHVMDTGEILTCSTNRTQCR